MSRFNTMEIAPDVSKPTDPMEIKKKIDLTGE